MDDVYACPTCYRVGPRIHRVRYSIAFNDLGPVLMCDRCLEALKARAAEYTEGHALGDFVWGVEIVDTHEGRRASSSPAKPPRSLGGVEV